jgi:hypothetical protein
MRVYANHYKNIVYLYCEQDDELINITLKSIFESKNIAEIFNSYNVHIDEDLEHQLNNAILEYKQYNGIDLCEVSKNGNITQLKKIKLWDDIYSWDIFINNEKIDSFIAGARDLAEIKFNKLIREN